MATAGRKRRVQTQVRAEKDTIICKFHEPHVSHRSRNEFGPDQPLQFEQVSAVFAVLWLIDYQIIDTIQSGDERTIAIYSSLHQQVLQRKFEGNPIQRQAKRFN